MRRRRRRETERRATPGQLKALRSGFEPGICGVVTLWFGGTGDDFPAKTPGLNAGRVRPTAEASRMQSARSTCTKLELG